MKTNILNTSTTKIITLKMDAANKPNRSFIIFTSGVAALGGLLFGCDTVIISGTIPYISEYFSMDEYMLGWSVSSILIGCAVGAMFAGKMADRYGRRLS